MIFIGGMHRSGTSWLTRTLNLCGVEVGERAAWAAPDNPKGFWEDRLLVAADEQILRQWGGTWYQPPAITLEEDTALCDATVEALLDGFAESEWIAYKDPRLSVTWPIFKNTFPEATLLAPLRHPHAVAQSLYARNQMPVEYGLKLWNDYNLRLLEWGARFVGFPGREGLLTLLNSLGLMMTPEAYAYLDEGAIHHDAGPVPEVYEKTYYQILNGIETWPSH